MQIDFIPESTIEEISVQLEKETGVYESLVAEFGVKQPVILSFLLSDNFDVLTPDERKFMLWLALVIWQSVEKINPELPVITQEQLGEVEERNWEKLNAVLGKRFREQLDVFFENYPQEDLLAFVEDALTLEGEEEESTFVLTKEGREPIFMGLKAIIDVLTL